MALQEVAREKAIATEQVQESSPLTRKDLLIGFAASLPTLLQSYLQSGNATWETGNRELMETPLGIIPGVSLLGEEGKGLVLTSCLAAFNSVTGKGENPFKKVVTRSAELFHIFGLTPTDAKPFIDASDRPADRTGDVLAVIGQMMTMPEENFSAENKYLLYTQTREFASTYRREPIVANQWLNLLANYTETAPPPPENTTFWKQIAEDVMLDGIQEAQNHFTHKKTMPILSRVPEEVLIDHQNLITEFFQKAQVGRLYDEDLTAYQNFLDRLPKGNLTLVQAVWTHTLGLQEREMNHTSYPQQLNYARITAVRLEDSLPEAEKAQAITSDHLIACILNERKRKIILTDNKWLEDKAAGISRELFSRADDKTMWETYKIIPNSRDYTNTLMTLLLASRPEFLLKVPPAGTDRQSPVWIQLLRDGDLPEQQRDFFLDIIAERFYSEDKRPLINAILDAKQDAWLKADGIAPNDEYLVAERTERWKKIFENVKPYIAGLADDLIAKRITKADALIAGLNNLAPERHGLPPQPEYSLWEKEQLLRVLTSTKTPHRAKKQIAEDSVFVDYFSLDKKRHFGLEECRTILEALASTDFFNVAEDAFRQNAIMADRAEEILSALTSRLLKQQESALVDLMQLPAASLKKQIDTVTLEHMVTTALFNWFVAIAIMLPSDMSPDTFHKTLSDIKMYAASRVFYKIQELPQWRDRLSAAVDLAQHPQLDRKRMEQIFLAADIPIPASLPKATTVFSGEPTPPAAE